jgi:hypothetical protein
MVVYDARPSQFNQMSTTAEWEYFQSAQVGSYNNGIDASAGSAMAPSFDVPGRNIVIADGNAVIKGQLWRCDAPVSTPIPVASAANRYDRLVLRYNRAGSTSATVVQPVVIQGTSGGGIPPVTQTTTGVWDLPICFWTALSNGGLQGLTDTRKLSNDRWHDMRSEFGGLQGGFTYPGPPELPPQFRMRDDGTMVDIVGCIVTPGGTYNGVNFYTMPAGYWSPQAASYPVVLSGNWSVGNENTNGTPRLYTASGGGLSVVGIPFVYNGEGIRIFGSYPVSWSNGLKTS